MKKIFIVIGAAVLMGSASCNLDRYPASGIVEEDAFQTKNDAIGFHNGFYASLRGIIYGATCYSGDVQADLWNASRDYGNRNGAVYDWSFSDDDNNISGVWQAYYTNIARFNFFLDNVDKIQLNSASDTTIIENYKGEAHLLRAYCYHQLVKYYAKAYNVNGISNEEELGLPIVSHFDVENKPSRSTLKETYQFILDDIAAAKALLNVAGIPGSEVVTVDCAKALEARVHLSMGNWVEAAAAADSLIVSGTYPLVNSLAALRNVWRRGNEAESILQLYAALNPSETAGTNNIYLGYLSREKKYAPDFIPEQWVVNLYEGNDIRKAVYFAEKEVALAGTTNNKLILFNKFPGDSSLFATITNYQHKPKVFRIAEMYLIKAEALAHVPAAEGNALSTLNVLRTSRGLGALSGLTGNSLLTEIKKERTRELIGEGTRLDDLKRWNEPVNRLDGGWQNSALIILGEATNQLIKQPGEDKFVWAIPSRDVSANPNLAGQQNPGW